MQIEKKILSLIDLTSLNENDTEASITALCQKAVTPHGHVAAVCVYPRFVKQVAETLVNKPVKIATVVNFPHATDSLENSLQSIKQSIADGAQEIDVVFPYPRYLEGDKNFAHDFIAQCKKMCGEKILLKAILETGALQKSQIIAQVCDMVILAGADFLKTSTGKIAVGATGEAADIMLRAIKKSKRLVGFKASGGVRTLEQAMQYLELATQIMGPNWVMPRTFRIGASQLVDEVLTKFC